MPDTQNVKSTQIQSVAKALKIIDYLASTHIETPLTKIASKLNMAKSTAHGLLSTLRDYGYVEQSPISGDYKLGVRLFEVGSVVANSWDVKCAADLNLKQLRMETEETVHLAVLSGTDVLYIDKRESGHSLRIVSEIGARLPVHCTGVGKALLAYLPGPDLKRILSAAEMKRFTAHTIVDVPPLLEELQEIRKHGYAMDDEEIMDSLRCIAAPVFNHEGKVCAAISVSAPVARFGDERISEIAALVMAAAKETSASLGCRVYLAGGSSYGA